MLREIYKDLQKKCQESYESNVNLLKRQNLISRYLKPFKALALGTEDFQETAVRSRIEFSGLNPVTDEDIEMIVNIVAMRVYLKASKFIWL